MLSANNYRGTVSVVYWASRFLCVEKFKEDAMDEKFRQDLLTYSSAQIISIDESKRPAYKPVNESFRKLAVD